MNLKNIDLSVKDKVNETQMQDIHKALDELDITLESDLDHYKEEYKKSMGMGVVKICYAADGVVEENQRGRVVLMYLGVRDVGIGNDDKRPFVKASGLENLCSDKYKISYVGGHTTIIKKGDDPIRYHLSILHNYSGI